MRRALFVAVLAGWTALLTELVVVVVLRRSEFANAWEIAVGSLLLAPTAFVLAAPAALFGAGLSSVLRGPAPFGRWLFAVLLALFGGTTAFLVAAGRHFAAPGARLGFGAGVLLLGLAAAYAAYPRLSGLARDRPRLLAVLCAALAVVADAGNRFVFVRLYPAFHAALAVLAVALAASTATLLVVSRARAGRASRWLLAVPAVAVASLALIQSGAEGLSRFDNLRLVLTDEAPMLGQAVAVAARIAPPPPLEEVACLPGAACAPRAETTAAPNLSGKDLVLVTIDALRADHVGAYGYPRPTSPELDALAREGALFEHAYCATPHTSYSVTSLLTGKYMRPLLLQGVGEDSETLATALRTYGYLTAAFYPPAVFFIDQARFEPFERSGFGFEYRKVEFMEGEGRVRQIASYLGGVPKGRRVFLWVHLFGPHEPYEAHPAHPFGTRDIDRYDSEIAAADATLGAIVRLVRSTRPGAVVVVAADHGEEFGEHGGRYHGTSVYEEQVRVPLVVSAPGAVAPRRVREVVQTIDLVPTLLAALAIPGGPRLRGRNLGPLLLGARAEEPGFAFVETEENALLAEGSHRLVCARKLGACRLYDLSRDPAEREDAGKTDPERLERLRRTLQALGASHGRFERAGLRAETGRGWPGPVVRALAGDADAAPDLAALLDDADPLVRRKAAELLFELRRSETVPALRLALGRDEDAAVRNSCALALTRLGQSVPLVFDLLAGQDLASRRLAALALAEAGDGRGEPLLVDWWMRGAKDDHHRALDLLNAFARLRTRSAVWPLVQSLGNVRLRPRIAGVLATIGDDTARGPLAAALAKEPYQTARIAITDAIVALGGREELARPLIRFLGVPDPLPGGLQYAERARILELVGGPDDRTRRALARQSDVGVLVRTSVPSGGNGSGVRLLVRARAEGKSGEVRVGRRLEPMQYTSKGELVIDRKAPRIHDRDFVSLTVPAGDAPVEISIDLPERMGIRPGRAAEVVAFAERHVVLESLALVPLADELPPPPPEPWAPAAPAPVQPP